MTDEINDLNAQAVLAEFSALRTEALQAFSMQWNTIALQLTATSVVFSFSLTNHARTGFLLIIPVICYVLNGRYLRNERLILNIAAYIMAELSPRIPGGLGWESWLRQLPSPKQALRWLAHGPLIFSGISLIALAWVIPFIFSGDNISAFDRSLLAIVWVVGLSLTMLSTYMIKVIVGGDLPLRELARSLKPGRAGNE